MESVIFVGLQGAGKSSFFKERFFSTHVRISLDVFKTRTREWRFLETALATRQRFVVDNTNPARADRVKYLQAAKAAGFSAVCYYFQSRVEDCLRRNGERATSDRVPDVAVLGTAAKLELPVADEGFDRMHYVRIQDGAFVVEEWRDEV